MEGTYESTELCLHPVFLTLFKTVIEKVPLLYSLWTAKQNFNSNPGPVVLEVTSLSTVPQPILKIDVLNSK